MGTAAPCFRLCHIRADGGEGGCRANRFLLRLVIIRSVNCQGFQGLGRSSTPSPSQDDDPISLKTPPKVGVELYVAVARLYVESGKFTEAEEQYQQAMKMAPNDIRALLGYAMLKDQMNQPQEALKLYQQAQQKYPKDPSVYNNQAIHYVRNGMVREAIEAGRRAAELRPREPRYRNNLAAIFVEAGMPQEAFKQLREVYDEPVSHYDLGFLLNKRGMKAAALQEFTIALQLNPGMTLARQWVERLSRERGEGSPAAIGMATSPGQAVATFQPAAAPPAPPPQYVVPPQNPNPAPGSTAVSRSTGAGSSTVERAVSDYSAAECASISRAAICDSGPGRQSAAGRGSA